jgi:hypothetical protein
MLQEVGEYFGNASFLRQADIHKPKLGCDKMANIIALHWTFCPHRFENPQDVKMFHRTFLDCCVYTAKKEPGFSNYENPGSMRWGGSGNRIDAEKTLRERFCLIMRW